VNLPKALRMSNSESNGDNNHINSETQRDDTQMSSQDNDPHNRSISYSDQSTQTEERDIILPLNAHQYQTVFVERPLTALYPRVDPIDESIRNPLPSIPPPYIPTPRHLLNRLGQFVRPYRFRAMYRPYPQSRRASVRMPSIYDSSKNHFLIPSTSHALINIPDSDSSEDANGRLSLNFQAFRTVSKVDYNFHKN
jgi:hypothetical protein